MSGILDRVAAQARSVFRPQTTPDYFAIRLAQKLGDSPAVRHYRQLMDQYAEGKLAAVYRRTMAVVPQPADFGRAFHELLKLGNGNGGDSHRYRLLAVKVERRSVAVAFFIGTGLDYVQVHHLPSARDKAGSSATGFINSMVSHLKADSAALEEMPPRSDGERVELSALIYAALSRAGLPVWAVDKQELIASFGHPAPRSIREVRGAVARIWPVLPDEPSVLEAVALGLYVQTERALSTEA